MKKIAMVVRGVKLEHDSMVKSSETGSAEKMAQAKGADCRAHEWMTRETREENMMREMYAAELRARRGVVSPPARETRRDRETDVGCGCPERVIQPGVLTVQLNNELQVQHVALQQ